MSSMEIEQQWAQRKAKLQVRAHLSVPDMGNTPARLLLNEDAFVSMLYLERRRAEQVLEQFVRARRSPLQRFCSHTCRRALERVAERERRWKRARDLIRRY